MGYLIVGGVFGSYVGVGMGVSFFFNILLEKVHKKVRYT